MIEKVQVPRIFTFGDSFTEGEGAWLEKTVEIENQYEDSSIARLEVSKFNSKYSWPKVFGDKLGIEALNLGSCGASNNLIFNTIIKKDKEYFFHEKDLIVVMWSSSMRDKLPFFPNLFQETGPVGLGWSFKEVFEDFGIKNFLHRYNIKEENKNYLNNTLVPFMNSFFKKYITYSFDNNYYNLLNFNYIYFLQEFFKFKGCNYIFIDGFESMNSFNKDYEKWDLIDKTKYWKFGESTAWDYLDNIGGDVFENQELSYNPPGQKCHPNRHGYRLIAEELFRFYKKSLDN